MLDDCIKMYALKQVLSLSSTSVTTPVYFPDHNSTKYKLSYHMYVNQNKD